MDLKKYYKNIFYRHYLNLKLRYYIMLNVVFFKLNSIDYKTTIFGNFQLFITSTLDIATFYYQLHRHTYIYICLF